MTAKHGLLNAVLFVAWLIASGCNQGPELPPLAPVTGKVTLDGTPLPRGSVQFSPDPAHGTEGPTATAEIQSDGTYTLSTAGQDGAMIGWHRARVVSKQEPKDEMDTDPKSLIPMKYSHPQRSGLSYEVTDQEENVINIELSSKPSR